MLLDRRFFGIALLLAAACGDSSAGSTSSDGATTSATAATSGSTTATTSGAGGAGGESGTGGAPGVGGGGGDTGAGGSLEGPGVQGWLRDEAGNILSGVSVLACNSSSCLYGASNAAGRFLFPMDPDRAVAVKTQEDDSTSPRSGAALVPIVTGADPIELGNVFVPSMPIGPAIGVPSANVKSFEAGDGLVVTLKTSDLEPELGHDLDDIAARAIPASAQHPIPGLDEEIVAVYALHPFAGTCASPVAFKAPSNLPAGTAVNFRAISWLDGTLSAAAKGKADGQFVTTNAGEGLHDLTWLVISKAP